LRKERETGGTGENPEQTAAAAAAGVVGWRSVVMMVMDAKTIDFSSVFAAPISIF